MSWSSCASALIVIALVSACTPAKTPTLNEQLAEKAKASVRDTLKDPTSVKFKEVRAFAKGNCIYGKLLAKNSFGAYTGYQDFVWIDGTTLIKPDSASMDSEAKTGGAENLDAYTSYLKGFNRCLGGIIKSGSDGAPADISDDV